MQPVFLFPVFPISYQNIPYCLLFQDKSPLILNYYI